MSISFSLDRTEEGFIRLTYANDFYTLIETKNPIIAFLLFQLIHAEAQRVIASHEETKEALYVAFTEYLTQYRPSMSEDDIRKAARDFVNGYDLYLWQNFMPPYDNRPKQHWSARLYQYAEI